MAKRAYDRALRQLCREMPASASPPRIMTGPHPEAVGSLGPEMLAWAEAERLQARQAPFRWWQRLVAYRALEVDRKGHLVWSTVLVSAPRQVGKSWLERAVCAWRIHQAGRFGEPQAVLHVAHKLLTAKEVWQPAAVRYKRSGEGYEVRFGLGQQAIVTPDESGRWMVQAGTHGAGVGFSLTMALVDEAWRIERGVVDDAIGPTLVEAESPQLWMVSTAGDSDSELMAANRALAIALAEEPGRLLLVEWSAPPDPGLDADDPEAWRAASPHWDERRAERVRQFRAAQTDYSFRQQWLNQWVPSPAKPLLDPARWRATESGEGPQGALSFAFDVAPDRSAAAVVAAGQGRVEVVAAEPGASWVAAEVRRLAARWAPAAVVADRHGPAVPAIEDLKRAEGFDTSVLREVNVAELVSACGELFDAVASSSVLHVPHPALDAAVAGAAKVARGGSWAFSRDAGGHVLVAAALAAWGDRHPARSELPAVY